MDEPRADRAQGPARPSTDGSGRGGFVYLAAVFAALGGLLFGYDTGVISGALLYIKKDFTLTTLSEELVVSMVLVGATIGAMGGGKLADRIGRRLTLIWTSVIFVAGAFACALSHSVVTLWIGRSVVGLGIGLACTAVPLYISEVAPARARGWQVSLFQLAITVGIVVAYLVDWIYAAPGGWRWMFAWAMAPGAILGLSMLFMPETPRWLAENGRTERARAVLVKIRGTRDVEGEFSEIEASLSHAEERGRLADLLSPAVRPALVIGVGLAVFQQVTGINTVIYYAPTIIQSAGVSSAGSAILNTAGIGAVNVVMTVVSMWLIDRVGRRPLLLTGIAGMVVTLGILGFVFHSGARSPALARLAVVTLMLYVASFAISLGPIFWLLISEIYPLRVRGLAEGVAAGSNWIFNFVVSVTFLSLVDLLGPSWTFWVYGLLAAASWLFSYFLVPETKGRTLEEIEAFWHTGKAAQ